MGGVKIEMILPLQPAPSWVKNGISCQTAHQEVSTLDQFGRNWVTDVPMSRQAKRGNIMHVTDIQISNPTYRHSLGELSAIVSLCSETRDVRLLCAVPAENEDRKSEGRIALVREALRQIRRMPELRAGREVLSFEPGLYGAEA